MMNRQQRRRGHEFKIHLLRGPEFATRMTCKEAKCEANAIGWVTVLNPQDEKHAGIARYIEGDSGRRYLKLRSEEALEHLANHGDQEGITLTPELRAMLERIPAGMLVFFFPPGQQCFRIHQDREVVFKHNAYTHVKPLDFNEDFNEVGDRVNTAIQRG